MVWYNKCKTWMDHMLLQMTMLHWCTRMFERLSRWQEGRLFETLGSTSFAQSIARTVEQVVVECSGYRKQLWLG